MPDSNEQIELMKTKELLAMVAEAQRSAEKTPFIQSMIDGTLPQEKWISYLTCVYPVEFTVCQGLMRSTGNFNAVNDTQVVLYLYRQGREEFDHNDLWREMLMEYGVNPARISDEFYRDSVRFPRPVEFFCRHLMKYAMNYAWEYLALQTAIEMLRCELVSKAIPPFMKLRPELFAEPESEGWWLEHHLNAGSAEEPRIAESLNMLRKRDIVPLGVSSILMFFVDIFHWHTDHTFDVSPFTLQGNKSKR